MARTRILQIFRDNRGGKISGTDKRSEADTTIHATRETEKGDSLSLAPEEKILHPVSGFNFSQKSERLQFYPG